MLGLASEVMAALGLAHLLVGRSHECKFPPSLLALPCVSSPALGPDLEQQSCATVHDRLSRRAVRQCATGWFQQLLAQMRASGHDRRPHHGYPLEPCGSAHCHHASRPHTCCRRFTQECSCWQL